MCIYPKPSMPILETHFARREAVPRALRHHPSLDQSTIKTRTAWCLWPSGPLQLSPISRHSVWPPAAPWVLYTRPLPQTAQSSHPYKGLSSEQGSPLSPAQLITCLSSSCRPAPMGFPHQRGTNRLAFLTAQSSASAVAQSGQLRSSSAHKTDEINK